MLESNNDDIKPGLITNGSNEALTFKLLHLAKADMIFCEVSIDKWHSKISKKVVELATRYKMVRHIDHPMREGRANDLNNNVELIDGCICDDLFICPNGDVYPCGCKTTYLGNILDKNFKVDEKYMRHMCERDYDHEDNTSEMS